MDVLITDQSLIPGGTSHVQATAGKTSAYVGQYDGRWITVCCNNASHRAHRSAGRTFETWDEAIAGYRSAEMRAIIHAARSIFTPNIIDFPSP